ncbi:hypothetical protein [Glutamicibacter sp. PS]|uniref:hypothetical protein n=1 Tax=Glutamicibacter sp. PS TaxID=3075634 RepID=UPI002851C2E2|nr:hypothetical protein [Glutamicibacter sp. PS]MDR4533213.1 hypothetical protein [Glutamicibacter sp. PS]
MSSLAIFQGVQALLPVQARSHLFEAELSDPPRLSDFPYVVIHGGWGDEVSGEPGDRSSCDIPDQAAMQVLCTMVATSREGLNAIVGQVRTALNRQRPVVAGWRFSRMIQRQVTTVEPDQRISIETISPLYVVDEFTFTAFRA